MNTIMNMLMNRVMHITKIEMMSPIMNMMTSMILRIMMDMMFITMLSMRLTQDDELQDKYNDPRDNESSEEHGESIMTGTMMKITMNRMSMT